MTAFVVGICNYYPLVDIILLGLNGEAIVLLLAVPLLTDDFNVVEGLAYRRLLLEYYAVKFYTS